MTTTVETTPTAAPEPVTFTLTTSKLHALFAPVLPFADKGDTLPVLAAVRVHSSGGYLYATATDRYRIGMQRVKVDELPEEELAFILERTAILGLLRLYKQVRGGGDPELTITAHRGLAYRGEPGDYKQVEVVTHLTVTGAGSFGFMDSSTRWGVLDGDYPKMSGVLLAAVERANEKPTELVPVVGAGFNPKYLADFQHAVPSDYSTPLVLWVTSDRLAMLVRIGEDFVGALMPVRFTGLDGSASELDESWRAALGAGDANGRPVKAAEDREQVAQ